MESKDKEGELETCWYGCVGRTGSGGGGVFRLMCPPCFRFLDQLFF